MTSYNDDNFKLEDDDILIETIINIYAGKSIDKYEESGHCDICWEDLKGKYVILLNCDHGFHRNCILQNIIKYKRQNCPSCK